VTAATVGGCAAPPPPGPTVIAVPGKDKTLAQFQEDDVACRQFAGAQTGGRSPGTGLGAGHSAVALQYGYNVAYMQCMMGKGQSVPVNFSACDPYGCPDIFAGRPAYYFPYDFGLPYPYYYPQPYHAPPNAPYP
jgi:hypothetical protein